MVYLSNIPHARIMCVGKSAYSDTPPENICAHVFFIYMITNAIFLSSINNIVSLTV